jgi:hypothetical protein
MNAIFSVVLVGFLAAPPASERLMQMETAESHRTVVGPGQPFDIVLQRDHATIVAYCESGCAWARFSGVSDDGSYRITRDGVEPGGPSSSRSSTDGFSITVQVGDRDIAAVCERGCGWTEVTAEFPGGAYRITQEGVSPLTGKR